MQTLLRYPQNYKIGLDHNFMMPRYKILRTYKQLQSFSRAKLHSTTTSKTSTKKSCIDLLKICKSISHFQQIQALLFIHGLHQNIDVLHKLIAFATSVNMAYAEKIFARVEYPTLFIYNVMIKVSVKTFSFTRALYLFDELRVRGLCPDNYTYPFVFKAVGKLRVAVQGEKIHGFVMKTGILYDCYVCNSVLDMYGEFGCVESMGKVFDEMPLRELISWNIMISGFVKGKFYENALGIYRRMVGETSMRPDEATVVSTLSACTTLKELDFGREIHEYIRTQFGFTMIIENALLDMYAKCGCLEMARDIFDGMIEKNVICWTSMVSGYINHGRLENARALFEKSPVKDLVLWTAMINGYVQYNHVNEAMVLFRKMQMDRVKPDKYTLVALLTGCAQLRALEQGEWIHAYLDENRISIDAVVGTALIEMYAKCGCLEKALKIFYNLNKKDTTSWTSIICALAMNGNTTRALQLFSEMMENGIRPDDITFIGVLSACSHGGLVEDGKMHFDSMSKIYHIEPKLEHYGCLIDLLGRAGLLKEAEDIITRVPKQDSKIIVEIYGALLSACRNYENVEMAERISKRVLEIESSNSSSHTLLASVYASASRWEDATKIRKEMTTKKLPGYSTFEVDEN